MIAHYFQQEQPLLICNTVIFTYCVRQRLRRSWIWKLLRVLELHWVGKSRTPQIRKQCLDVSMRSYLRYLHTAGWKCGYPGAIPMEFLLNSTFALPVTLGGAWDYSSTSGATLCRTWQSGGKSQETRNTTSLFDSIFQGTLGRPHCRCQKRKTNIGIVQFCFHKCTQIDFQTASFCH